MPEPYSLQIILTLVDRPQRDPLLLLPQARLLCQLAGGAELGVGHFQNKIVFTLRYFFFKLPFVKTYKVVFLYYSF